MARRSRRNHSLAFKPKVALDAIGRLTSENDFSRTSARARRRPKRKAMIDAEHDLPLTAQAELLAISHSSFYYNPRPILQGDLELTRRMDRLLMDYPFAGARMLRDMLKREGVSVGRRHVARLMGLMGIEALYRKKRTSKWNPEHAVFPYLLRGVATKRPTTYGRLTSRTSRCGTGFSIYSLYSTGIRVVFWRGGFRTG